MLLLLQFLAELGGNLDAGGAAHQVVMILGILISIVSPGYLGRNLTERVLGISVSLCFIGLNHLLVIRSLPGSERLRAVSASLGCPDTGECRAKIIGSLRTLSRASRPAEGLQKVEGRMSGQGFPAMLVIAGLGDVPWLDHQDLHPNDRVHGEWVLKLLAVDGGKLPSPFSYSAFLLRRGVLATAQSRAVEVSAVRQQSLLPTEAIQLQVSEIEEMTPAVAVLFASTLGKGDLLDEGTKALFRETGLTHVLVVSGYQVGVVFLLFRRIFLALLSRMPLLALSIPLEVPASIAGFLFALGYTCLLGGMLSSVRALFALSIVVAGSLLNRKANPVRSLALVYLLVQCLWPGSVFEAGCQLTFAALIGLLAAAQYLRKLEQKGKLRTLLSYNFFPILMTSPIVLLWFQTWTPGAMIFNLLFAPALCVLGTLAGGSCLILVWLSVPGSAALLRVCLWLIECLLSVLECMLSVTDSVGLGIWEIERVWFALALVSPAYIVIFLWLYRNSEVACAAPGTMALVPGHVNPTVAGF